MVGFNRDVVAGLVLVYLLALGLAVSLSLFLWGLGAEAPSMLHWIGATLAVSVVTFLFLLYFIFFRVWTCKDDGKVVML